MANEYDVVVLGGGTGGYVAAIRAAQLGLKTAIVEKDKLGGTCLHKGCIPSKVLLRSAEVFAGAQVSEAFGVMTSSVTLNFEKVQERKNKIVAELYKGVQQLMKNGQIDIYEGFGRIMGPSIFSPLPGTISVEMKNGAENEMLLPKNVIIATGSRPRMLRDLMADGEHILTSDEALELKTLPSSMIIIGGGVIGLEWASIFSDFGVRVTVIENEERIIGTEDKDISKEMERVMKKKGVEIVTGANVYPDSLRKGGGVTITAEINGSRREFQADKLLLSIGRMANTEGFGLENTEIKVEKGFIVTNEFFQTSESHIYAIGDCIGGLQLAHTASREGIVAIEHIAGKNPAPVDYSHIPKCIYSRPEAASIGLSEEKAKEHGYNVKIGKFPMRANGKALVFGQTDGFVKVVADRETNDILGVHILGPHATELISEAGIARFLDATPWEVANTIHPHPTLSEAIGEAALAVDGMAIHG